MPETDVIPTSASVASTGKGIRYIGDHAYAYSGAVVTGGGGSADGTVLEFTTGSGYISGQLMYQVDDLGGPTLYVEVKINDVVVFNLPWDTASVAMFLVDLPINFILPPFSKFELLTGSSAGNDTWTAQFIGRVYGEE